MDTKYFRDDSVLSDILALVSVEVPVEVIATWSDEQCEKAEWWACKYHLKANDHTYIRVPNKPKFLNKYTKE